MLLNLTFIISTLTHLHQPELPKVSLFSSVCAGKYGENNRYTVRKHAEKTGSHLLKNRCLDEGNTPQDCENLVLKNKVECWSDRCIVETVGYIPEKELIGVKEISWHHLLLKDWKSCSIDFDPSLDKPWKISTSYRMEATRLEELVGFEISPDQKTIAEQQAYGRRILLDSEFDHSKIPNRWHPRHTYASTREEAEKKCDQFESGMLSLKDKWQELDHIRDSNLKYSGYRDKLVSCTLHDDMVGFLWWRVY